MPVRKERLVFGAVIWVTRTFGCILIVLAVLGLPQLQSLTGRLSSSFGLITSLALALAGVVWLIAVQLFLRFFDRYLSRN